MATPTNEFWASLSEADMRRMVRSVTAIPASMMVGVEIALTPDNRETVFVWDGHKGAVWNGHRERAITITRKSLIV